MVWLIWEGVECICLAISCVYSSNAFQSRMIWSCLIWSNSYFIRVLSIIYFSNYITLTLRTSSSSLPLSPFFNFASYPSISLILLFILFLSILNFEIYTITLRCWFNDFSCLAPPNPIATFKATRFQNVPSNEFISRFLDHFGIWCSTPRWFRSSPWDLFFN